MSENKQTEIFKSAESIKRSEAVGAGLEIIAALYEKMHVLALHNSNNIRSLEAYARVLDKLDSADKDFKAIENIGKKMVQFLLAKKSPEQVNEFIELYKEFAEWYGQS